MEATVFENRDNVSTDEVLNEFVQTLERTYAVEKSEIEMLTDIFAKNPVDKFIISEMPTEEMYQGDIIIWSELTPQYKENIRNVKDLKETNRMILQDGDSVTGDHEVVPVSTANYTMTTGKFPLKILAWKIPFRKEIFWDCKILDTDSPFILKHREHGNITFLTPGKYMFCSQMKHDTLQKVMD